MRKQIIHCGRNGGRKYFRIYKPDHPHATSNGYVLEHRIIIENSLGRYLESNEHVHHINEDPLDNRIENLRLVTMREHMSIHFKKDLSGRRCVDCGSDRTYVGKSPKYINGSFYLWYKQSDGFLCSKCYNRHKRQ